MTGTSHNMRLLLALGLSLAGFALTHYWYKKTAIEAPDRSADQESLGVVDQARREVQRKPSSRLIWIPVLKSESVFDGDAIRTGAGSEAQIVLDEGRTVIALEPDSAIVVSKNSGTYTMDFIKGQLTVKSTAPDQKVQLKSDGKVVDLGNTEAKLEKSPEGQVSVQVIKGNQEKIQKALAGNDLVLNPLKPAFEEEVFLDFAKNEKVNFSWKKIPSEYLVFVEMGKKRSDLKAVNEQAFAGDTNDFATTLAPGSYLWRLRAKKASGGKDLFSSSIRFKVDGKLPPVLESPIKDLSLSLDDSAPDVKFSWSNPGKLKNLMLEVTKDPSFREVTHRLTADDKLEALARVPEAGQYFWRVAGYHPRTKEILSSEIRKLKIEFKHELKPPVLIHPSAQQTLSYLQILKEKITFRWSMIVPADKYEVILEKNGKSYGRYEAKSDAQLNAKIDAKNPLLTLNQLPPGNYRWMVSAKSGVSEKFKKSQEIHSDWSVFSVEKQNVNLAWADGLTEVQQNYWSGQPKIEAKIKYENPLIQQLRYRIANSPQELTNNNNEDSLEKLWKNLVENKIVAEVKQDGVYYVVVEGLDRTGQGIAKTPLRKVKVAWIPLLQPPEISSQNNEILAQPNGVANITWKEVSRAKNYRMLVRPLSADSPNWVPSPDRDPASEGGLFQDQKILGTQTSVRRLMPGRYALVMASIDEYGRQGAFSDVKIIIVSDKSDVRAPKIKNLEVQ